MSNVKFWKYLFLLSQSFFHTSLLHVTKVPLSHVDFKKKACPVELKVQEPFRQWVVKGRRGIDGRIGLWFDIVVLHHGDI